MNMEEIVALSVKHNVSDLHLCNAWPARWRIRGKVEIAPFTAPGGTVDVLSTKCESVGGRKQI